MTHSIYVYILLMAAISLCIRVLPLTLIRKQIKNRFLQSFLYYVPYVTLAVMTFPAIMDATQSPSQGCRTVSRYYCCLAWRRSVPGFHALLPCCFFPGIISDIAFTVLKPIPVHRKSYRQVLPLPLKSWLPHQ